MSNYNRYLKNKPLRNLSKFNGDKFPNRKNNRPSLNEHLIEVLKTSEGTEAFDIILDFMKRRIMEEVIDDR